MNQETSSAVSCELQNPDMQVLIRLVRACVVKRERMCAMSSIVVRDLIDRNPCLENRSVGDSTDCNQADLNSALPRLRTARFRNHIVAGLERTRCSSRTSA